MDEIQDAIRRAYLDLYDELNSAYWAASNMEDKDRIRGAAEQVYETATALNAEDIVSRNEEYAALTNKIQSVNERLKKLSGEIDAIIHNTKIAADVVNGIAKVLGAAVGIMGKHA